MEFIAFITICTKKVHFAVVHSLGHTVSKLCGVQPLALCDARARLLGLHPQATRSKSSPLDSGLLDGAAHHSDHDAQARLA